MSNEERIADALHGKPRMFLIGEPEALGFKREELDIGSALVDDDGVMWMNMVAIVGQLIFVMEKGVSKKLYTEWINRKLYYVEPSEDSTFNGLVNDAKDHWEKAEPLVDPTDYEVTVDEEVVKILFEYSTPITTYAVPEQGTKMRKIYSAIDKIRNTHKDRLGDIRRQLEELARSLGVTWRL